MKTGSFAQHSLNIKQGVLSTWGNNNHGQLGLGTGIDSLTPTPVSAPDTLWHHLAAGGSHTLTIKADGTLWASGANNFGQRGDGSSTLDRNIFAQIGTDTDWVSVSAGDNHSMGMKSDGSLWTWGHNDHSQLGDASLTNYNVPTQVISGNDWIAIEAGSNHCLALKSDNSLWAWGFNSFGQVGNGLFTDQHTQYNVPGVWIAISAGGYHSLAMQPDGTLWAWGGNIQGELGNGTYSGNVLANASPAQVHGPATWVSFGAGGRHNLALQADGTLWSWGYNDMGQLGNGTHTMSNIPTQMSADNDWISFSAGYEHSLGLKSDRTVWAWGKNNHGQLGLGTTTAVSSPTQITAI